MMWIQRSIMMNGDGVIVPDMVGAAVETVIKFLPRF